MHEEWKENETTEGKTIKEKSSNFNTIKTNKQESLNNQYATKALQLFQVHPLYCS